jgi:hypothetical protein
MTMIVDVNRYPSKKSLKEALERGETITIEDPSIFNPKIFTTEEMERGQKVIVTNHPKRSYFAEIFKDVDGRFKVK